MSHDPANGARVSGSRLPLLLAILLLNGCAAQPERQVVTDAAPPIPAETPSPSSPPPTSEPVAAILPVRTADPAETSVPTAPSASAVSEPTTAVRSAAASAYWIEIPRLGVNLPVAEGDVPRDVEQERTPENYAFHLPGTSMFGAGNTYIYAHARSGMFLSLWNARIGDLVIARTPNGTREYVVAEIHPRVPPTQISWAGPTVDTRLTLQTSTGPNSDDPRFVVVARPR